MRKLAGNLAVRSASEAHRPSPVFSTRGVAYWQSKKEGDGLILYGTFDGRLMALDAKTGKPRRDLEKTAPLIYAQGRGRLSGSEYSVTSPSAIYQDLVITGAAVPEYPSKGPSGEVRAFDVSSGKLVWSFHTIPAGRIGTRELEGDAWKERTGANVWSIMSVDAERGLVFFHWLGVIRFLRGDARAGSVQQLPGGA